MTEPRFAHAYRELALVAVDLRDQRAAGDGKAIEAGRLTPAQAADRLRVAASVAAEWGGEDPWAAPIATPAERLAMLDQATTVVTARAERARLAMVEAACWTGQTDRGALWSLAEAEIGPVDLIRDYLDHESRAAALDALRWWQARGGAPAFARLANRTAREAA